MVALENLCQPNTTKSGPCTVVVVGLHRKSNAYWILFGFRGMKHWLTSWEESLG